MQKRLLIIIASLLLGALLSWGCGRKPLPAATTPKTEPMMPPTAQPEETAPAHELEQSTLRVADPEGRWTFALQSARAEAAGVHGPYTLVPAQGLYKEKGREPVNMSADRATVSEDSQQVLFEGNVRIASGGWMLEADRVEYDLKKGKVVASGRTKWNFTESFFPITAEESKNNEKTITH